jgi:hypothetical protein
MAFTCVNELEISGGSEEERRAASALVLAAESADEGTAMLRETEPAASGASGQAAPLLVLRFQSVDGLPEEELAAMAPQFPALSFTLAYFSLDGEFFGYAKTGAGDSGPGAAAAESADFADDTRDIVGRRHDGDGIAFVKETYGLLRR